MSNESTAGNHAQPPWLEELLRTAKKTEEPMAKKIRIEEACKMLLKKTVYLNFDAVTVAKDTHDEDIAVIPVDDENHMMALHDQSTIIRYLNDLGAKNVGTNHVDSSGKPFKYKENAAALRCVGAFTLSRGSFEVVKQHLDAYKQQQAAGHGGVTD